MSELFGRDGGVVSRGHARHANVGWKKCNGVDNAFAASLGTVNGVAPVMFRGRPKIPAVGSVDRPDALDVRLLVNDNRSAGRCKGRFIKAECSVELCLGGQSWIDLGLAKEIERQRALRKKAAPEEHGKLFAGAAEAGNEMIFPAANGAFG
jgi:hypothetical protein